jgi:hypothetical protein
MIDIKSDISPKFIVCLLQLLKTSSTIDLGDWNWNNINALSGTLQNISYSKNAIKSILETDILTVYTSLLQTIYNEQAQGDDHYNCLYLINSIFSTVYNLSKSTKFIDIFSSSNELFDLIIFVYKDDCLYQEYNTILKATKIVSILSETKLYSEKLSERITIFMEYVITYGVDPIKYKSLVCILCYLMANLLGENYNSKICGYLEDFISVFGIMADSLFIYEDEEMITLDKQSSDLLLKVFKALIRRFD